MVQITGVSATGSVGEVGVRAVVFDFQSVKDQYSRRRTVYLSQRAGIPLQRFPDTGAEESNLKNPQFTYSEDPLTLDLLTLITYEGGHTKAFTYNSDKLPIEIKTTIDGVTTTKTLNYDDDKFLDFITDS